MPTYDTRKIRRVGCVQLPHIAGNVRGARESLEGTSDAWIEPFRDRPQRYLVFTVPSMYSASMLHWIAAAQEFILILDESAHRLDKAAEAMIKIADNYDRAEAEGVQILEDLQRRLDQVGTGE